MPNGDEIKNTNAGQPVPQPQAGTGNQANPQAEPVGQPVAQPVVPPAPQPVPRPVPYPQAPIMEFGTVPKKMIPAPGGELVEVPGDVIPDKDTGKLENGQPGELVIGRDKGNAVPDAQHSVLKNSPNGISYQNFKQRVFDYYGKSQERLLRMPSEEQIRYEYDHQDDEGLMKLYNTMLLDNRRNWEFTTLRSLPRAIATTNNVGVLSKYLEDNKENLTYEQRFLIQNHIQVAQKSAKINLDASVAFAQGKPYFEVFPVVEYTNEKGEKGYELTNVVQKDFQTSNNGCWSCFFQNLASGKGVDVSQEDIRAYRPDLTLEESEKLNNETYNAYSYDDPNSALEMGDSVLSFLPNTMLCEVEIPKCSRDVIEDGGNEEEYLKSAYEQIKKTVTHAIRDEHSPVGVLQDGHYITIVGIEGDKIRYKDSMAEAVNIGQPNFTHTKTIQELFGSMLKMSRYGMDFGSRPLQLTYASEIKLSKDGTTLFGVPSDYVKLAGDGKVTKQPKDIRDGAHLMPEGDPELNRGGTVIARYGRKEETPTEHSLHKNFVGGIYLTEKVYLPKNLQVDYLKMQAVGRTLEEENALREKDRRELGNDRPDLKPEEVKLGVGAGIQAPQEGPVLMGLDPAREREEADRVAEQKAAAREEAARNETKKLNQDSVQKGIENGFKAIREGKHPELFLAQYMHADPCPLEKIPDAELKDTLKIMGKAMGVDLHHAVIMENYGVVDKFFYTDKNGTRVNLVQSVKSQLQASGKFQPQGNQELKDEYLYKVARAQMLRLAADKNAHLSYENGDHKLDDLSIGEIPALTPNQKLAGLQGKKQLSFLDYKLLMDIRSLDLPEVEVGTLAYHVGNLTQTQRKACISVYDQIFGKQADPNVSKEEVILRLANGMPVQYQGEEVTPLKGIIDNWKKTVATAEDKAKIHDISFVVALDKPVRGLTQGVTQIRQNVSSILAELQMADQKWFRSSDEYRAVTRSMREVSDLVYGTWEREIEEHNPITVEMMGELLQKLANAKQAMRKYLEHKEAQMLADPARRNDPGKRSHEQRRIEKMINSLNKVDLLSENTERDVLKGAMEDVIKLLSRGADRESYRLMDMTLSEEDLELSVINYALKNELQNSRYYTCREKASGGRETLQEAIERMIGDSRIVVTAENKEEMLRRFPVVAEVARTAMSAYRGPERLMPVRSQLNQYQMDARENDRKSHYAGNSRGEEIFRLKQKLLADLPGRMQSDSREDATYISGNVEDGLNRLDDLYGKNPGITLTYHELTKNNQAKNKQTKNNRAKQEEDQLFAEFRDSFKAVGGVQGDNDLSSKDFAAIAFFASVASQVEGYEKYTFDLADANIDPARFREEVGTGIEIGRQQARAALLLNGDATHPNRDDLTGIITKGLQTAEAYHRAHPDRVNGAVVEMEQRLLRMLRRDPELDTMVRAGGLQKKTIEYLNSMEVVARIESKADSASRLLFVEGNLRGREEISDCLTDLYMKNLLQESRLKKTGQTNSFIENLGRAGAYEQLRGQVHAMVYDTVLSDPGRDHRKDYAEMIRGNKLMETLLNYKVGYADGSGRPDPLACAASGGAARQVAGEGQAAGRGQVAAGVPQQVQPQGMGPAN